MGNGYFPLMSVYIIAGSLPYKQHTTPLGDCFCDFKKVYFACFSLKHIWLHLFWNSLNMWRWATICLSLMGNFSGITKGWSQQTCLLVKVKARLLLQTYQMSVTDERKKQKFKVSVWQWWYPRSAHYYKCSSVTSYYCSYYAHSLDVVASNYVN